MPPKRPNKRKSQDEGGKPPKKGGKGKKEPTYDTYDEALDGGVEMEEKGERYRDGDKVYTGLRTLAQRFYERALDLYKKAYDFNPTYDAAYNQARVLFTLATDFFLPPTSVSYLTTSIELYRHSITLTQNTLLQLDAAYNLAQALLELGDVIEDLHPDRKSDIRKVREEAKDLLERVMLGQEENISRTAEEFEIDQASETIEENKPTEVDGKGEDQSGMEVDTTENEEDEEGGESGSQTTFESHVPTPTSLIDTVLLLIDTHLTLWTTTEPSAPPSEPEQQAVRSILDKAATIVPPGRQPELDLAEIKVLLSIDEIVWDNYKTEAKVGTEIEKTLESATTALTSLLSSLDVHPASEPTFKSEVLVTLASTHSTRAHRLLYLLPQLPAGPNHLAQNAWYNLSQAITHLNTALELPTTADTPKSFKPSVLLELSNVSLSRVKLKDVNETAKNNLSQLVDNALTYGIRAAESLKWGSFVKSGSTSSTGISTGMTLSIGGGGASGQAPYQNGWAIEWLSRSILLQIIRVAFISSNLDGLSDDIKAKCQAVMTTLKKGISTLSGERKIVERDYDRFIEDIEDEEQKIEPFELEFWKGRAMAR